MNTIILITCLLGVVVDGIKTKGPVVQTKFGPVQGRKNEKGTTTYHGIPFAKPPTGDLRFRPPQDPDPWNKTREATLFSSHQCSQLDLIKGVRLGREDCLYLSLYVPESCTTDSPCPVLQWIYGGAWILGSNWEFGRYDATTLVEKYDVIVVAGNYRLDSLGWLALDELQNESSTGSFGNYGLHDQRFAMKWTQENIRAFGGDPNKVTIFGESAGGFSVCQHIVSPASNGLFSHAIMESGDCDGPWMIFPGDTAKQFGDRFATYIGCPAGPDRLSCLRNLKLENVMMPYTKEWLCRFQKQNSQTLNPFCNETSTNTITSTSSRWPEPRPPMAPVVGFAAVVDGTDEGLPKVPYELIKEGKINKSPTGEQISVIFGTNRDELALFLVAMPFVIPNIKLPFDGTADMALVASHLTSYHTNWGDAETQKIVDAYPRSDYKSGNMQIVRAGTDFCFTCGTRDSARALASHNISVYVYSFEFEGDSYIDPSSLLCTLDDELLCGVYHGSEVAYVFQDPSGSSERTKSMMSAIGSYWTQMAKTGSPNGEGLVHWPAFTKENDLHLKLDENITVESGLRKKTCDFWDSLPKESPY